MLSRELNLLPWLFVPPIAIKQIANGKKSRNALTESLPEQSKRQAKGSERIKSDIEFSACLFVTKNCLLLGFRISVFRPLMCLNLLLSLASV